MGTVWLAEHAVMGRPVAVKVIRPEYLSQPGAVERFTREVRAAASLHHPQYRHRVRRRGGRRDAPPGDGVHRGADARRPAGRRAAAGRRGVPGGSRRGPWAGRRPRRRAGPPGREAAQPGPHGATGSKLLDFGLATPGTPTGLTGANVVIGTPDYIAPEQAADPARPARGSTCTPSAAPCTTCSPDGYRSRLRRP